MYQLRSRRVVAGDSSAANLVLIFLLAVLLTALALPAYRNYTLREHNKLARIVLEDVGSRHKIWQPAHPAQRPASLESLGYPSLAVYVSSDGTVSDSASISSIYRVSLAFPAGSSAESCGFAVDDPAGNGFVIVAEPIQTQRTDAQCGRLCLSSAGQRGASGAAGPEKCWSPH